MGEPVVLFEYDPHWPTAFQALRERLLTVVGDLRVAIEHIGGTSVPGLTSKPIIDIDLIVLFGENVAPIIERLCANGYIYEGELGVEGRHALRTQNDMPRHHLYVCRSDNNECRRHLAFRDYLRSHPDTATAYAELKMSAANEFRNDRRAYTQAKTEFIEQVLRLAECRTGSI